MLEFTMVPPGQADLANGKLTGTDFHPFQVQGKIPRGATVKINLMNTVFTGVGALLGVKDFNAQLYTPWGPATLDGSAAPIFPTGKGFSGSWGKKGGVFAYNGNISFGDPATPCALTIEGFTNGSNCGGIYRLGQGKIYANGVTIKNCDDLILATALPQAGDWIWLDNCELSGGGIGDGQSHNIYDESTLFGMRGTRSLGANTGHTLKKLGGALIVINSQLGDLAGRKVCSYMADLNSGLNYLIGVSGDKYPNALNPNANPSLAVFFSTQRIRRGPMGVWATGCTLRSRVHYRGRFFAAENPYLDPAVDYHKAKQLGWEPATVRWRGNELQAQAFPDKIDYLSKSWANVETDPGMDYAEANNAQRALRPDGEASGASIDLTDIAASPLGEYVVWAVKTPSIVTTAWLDAVAQRVAQLNAAWVAPA